jgi:intracellular multiplication protein IcmT
MNWFWRDTARTPQVFGMDATAVFPFLLFMVHIRWWTFGVAVVSMIALAILARFGFTGPVFLRFVRSFFAGPVRFAVSWAEWNRRR